MGSAQSFIDPHGLRMHSISAGLPEAETVVLLHGFPESSYAWRHQIDSLVAAGYRVVVPDQRGYSLTGKTPPYDLATLFGDIVGLIDTLACDRVHLAGHVGISPFFRLTSLERSWGRRRAACCKQYLRP